MASDRDRTEPLLLRFLAGTVLCLTLSACTPALYPLQHGITIDGEGRPLVPG